MEPEIIISDATKSFVDKTHLCPPVASNDYPKRSEVEYGEDDLSREYAFPMIGKSIKKAVNVNVQSWVDKRSGVSFDVVVIPFSFDVQRDLLHVRLPVNFSISSRVSSCDERTNSRILYMVSSILSHHKVLHR